MTELSKISLKTKKIPNDNQFNFFPSLKELHTKYKDIDLDAETYELQTLYDFLDYSSIEEKYLISMKWLKLRFILFATLFFLIPVCLGYIFARTAEWYQRY